MNRPTLSAAALALLLLLAVGCDRGDDDDTGGQPDDDTTGNPDDDDSSGSPDDDDDDSSGNPDDDDDTAPGIDPFADEVVTFTPGAFAGFGEAGFPDVVLGPPEGGGDASGSTDVLTLGEGGEIVLRFTDMLAVDGPGVDLLVFENPFGGYYETARVAVSDDGVVWAEFPCDPDDAANLYPGCAGIGSVFSNSTNGVDPTDPEVAGGDGFDLADVGLATVGYVRIQDSGANLYGGDTGGFDLDAVAIVNGQ
jgi:hypothetical protein